MASDRGAGEPPTVRADHRRCEFDCGPRFARMEKISRSSQEIGEVASANVTETDYKMLISYGKDSFLAACCA
jgi:hypothetical protein